MHCLIGTILKIDCIELIEEIVHDRQRAEEITKFIFPTFKKNELCDMPLMLYFIVYMVFKVNYVQDFKI